MNESNFSLIYDGSGIQGGTMNAIELGQAIIAFRELAEEAIGIVCPEQHDIELRVQSGFKKGSFEIDWTLVLNESSGLFGSSGVKAIGEVLAAIGISGYGVFQLIKRAKGEVPHDVIDLGDDNIRLVFSDKSEATVQKKIYRFFKSNKTREAIAKIAKPLSGLDADEFRLVTMSSDEPVFAAKRSEADYFKEPRQKEVVLENKTNEYLRIKSLSFVQGNKWRLSDGDRTFFVVIEDMGFVERITSGNEEFSSDDLIYAELLTKQWVENGKLKTSRRLTHVIRHIKGTQSAAKNELI